MNEMNDLEHIGQASRRENKSTMMEEIVRVIERKKTKKPKHVVVLH